MSIIKKTSDCLPGFGLSPTELRALADEFWRMFVEEEETDEAFVAKAEDWFWRAMASLTEEENHAVDAGERICEIAQSMLYSEAVALEMVNPTTMKTRVNAFILQPTRSFPQGAPQREKYDTDEDLFAAEKLYAQEWREEYECQGCQDRCCPQCGES